MRAYNGGAGGLQRPFLSSSARGRAAVNVYFLRHGQTDFNLHKRVQGQIDTHGLNAHGRAQMEALARAARAAGLRCDSILSSPLSRARQSAAPLSALFGVPVATARGLMEMHFGPWEGMAHADIERCVFTPPLVFRTDDGGKYAIETGAQLRACHASTHPMYATLCHPGGETKQEVRVRAEKAVFAHLAENAGARNVWIVAHSAVNRQIVACHASPAAAQGGMKNGEIAHFTYEDGALRWQGRLMLVREEPLPQPRPA